MDYGFAVKLTPVAPNPRSPFPIFKLYQFAKRMRQMGHLVETRFIASLSKDVLLSLIELVLGLIITPLTIVGGVASGTLRLELQIVWEDAASQSLQSCYLFLFALRKLVEALFEEDANLQQLV